MLKKVIGHPPERCEVCTFPMENIVYDAHTPYGPWAWLCPSCFDRLGCQLGVGRGQKYVKSDGIFYKVEGWID